jgi:hypothetical protein
MLYKKMEDPHVEISQVWHCVYPFSVILCFISIIVWDEIYAAKRGCSKNDLIFKWVGSFQWYWCTDLNKNRNKGTFVVTDSKFAYFTTELQMLELVKS